MQGRNRRTPKDDIDSINSAKTSSRPLRSKFMFDHVRVYLNTAAVGFLASCDNSHTLAK